jgi:nucleotide-binding universal stress UspA family protein
MGIGGASYKQQRDQVLIADAHQQARDFEQLFLERCTRAGVQGRVLEATGKPAEAILAEMEHHDLVFLGRDANFRFETETVDERTWDLVLHRASRPVIVVPEDPLPAGTAAVVAYDGSLAADRALRGFTASGLAQGRELHVVTINANGAVAWDVANEAVETLKGLGFAAQLHNVVSVLPMDQALLATAVNVGARMIVMGAFAHSRMRHLFRGSMTHQLVESTTIPLFLTH